jgi:hypothetical protein
MAMYANKSPSFSSDYHPKVTKMFNRIAPASRFVWRSVINDLHVPRLEILLFDNGYHHDR